MTTTVHGMLRTHPLESSPQASWFQSFKGKLAQAALRFWKGCERAGERRARSHLLWLADCHEGGNPELAQVLRNAARRHVEPDGRA